MPKPTLVPRRGDRIVFLGDSITEQHLYTNYVEAYLATRYPELNLEFVNVGWGGDTVGKVLNRLDRDVLSLKPTLVTICLGMNDGSYTQPTPSIVGTFADGLAAIVTRLRKARIRVVLLTPGFADVATNANLARCDYNRQGLRALADRVLALAKREKLPVADLHRLMTEVDARAKAADPRFTMAPDGFHPDQAGHLVMAYGLLQALGVPPWRDEIVVDAKRGAATTRAGRATVVRGDDGVGLRVELARVPFFVEPAARKVLPYLPFIADFASLKLIARGVGDEPWHVRSGAMRATLSGAQLAQGIELATEWSLPPAQAGASVLRFVNAKERAFFQCWREIALDGAGGGAGDDLAAIALGARTAKALDRRRNRLFTRARRSFALRLFPSSIAGEPVDEGAFIAGWALRGPLPRPWDVDALGGEAACSEPGRALPGAWRALDVDVAAPADNLQQALGPGTQCFAYACVDLGSPVAQRAELLLGSDDGLAAWLNGERVLANLDVGRGVTPDQERVPVRLRAGANRLLLKISQQGGAWGFCARFAGLKRALRAQPPAASAAQG